MWTSEDGSDTYHDLWEIVKQQEAADLERSLLMSLIRSFQQRFLSECRDNDETRRPSGSPS